MWVGGDWVRGVLGGVCGVWVVGVSCMRMIEYENTSKPRAESCKPCREHCQPCNELCRHCGVHCLLTEDAPHESGDVGGSRAGVCENHCPRHGSDHG